MEYRGRNGGGTVQERKGNGTTQGRSGGATIQDRKGNETAQGRSGGATVQGRYGSGTTQGRTVQGKYGGGATQDRSGGATAQDRYADRNTHGRQGKEQEVRQSVNKENRMYAKQTGFASYRVTKRKKRRQSKRSLPFLPVLLQWRLGLH